MTALTAEPGQGSTLDPAPVPDTSTDAPSPPDDELVDGTGGSATPGALPGPDDADSDSVSEPPADGQPEPNQHSAPVAVIEYSARLTVFDLLDALPDAAANTTDVDLIGMVDDLADWCHRFFAARKEMAA